MNKIFTAKINWLSGLQNTRKTIPWGDTYVPIIIIKGAAFSPDNDVWSLFVINKEKINDFETIAEVKYFSDKAPDNLKKDVEFSLYEGSDLVAQGIIL